MENDIVLIGIDNENRVRELYYENVDNLFIDEDITWIFNVYGNGDKVNEIIFPKFLRYIGSGCFSGFDNLKYLDFSFCMYPVIVEDGAFYNNSVEVIMYNKYIPDISNSSFDISKIEFIKDNYKVKKRFGDNK